MFLPGLQSDRRKMDIFSQAIVALKVRYAMSIMFPANYESISCLQASLALGMTSIGMPLQRPASRTPGRK